MAMLVQPRPKPQMQSLLREAPQAQPFVGQTPRDVEAQRRIAAELAKSAGDTSPIQHWTQGLGRLADGVIGALAQRRASQEEKAGRQSASDALRGFQTDSATLSPQDRIAKLMVLADNPWLGEGSRGAVSAMMASELPKPQTDDMREYEAAKSGGFQGSFMDYMQSLKTPVFQPPQGYAVAPDSKPGAPKVVRAEGLPADPAAAPKPSVQKAEDDDIAAVQGVQSINAQLDGIDGMIAGGKLDLGFFNNLGSRVQNFAGASTENSTNYATMMSTLEKMRNDSLRLNTGVQTEGDAIRAWNELVANVNDPKVVRAQIARIKGLNERAAQQRLQMIDIRRQRNNMEPFDPASVALPGAPPEQFTPPDGGQAAPVVPPVAAPPAAPTGTPQPGAIEDGMRFKGGDPSKPESWEPVAGGQGGPELAVPPMAADQYGLQDLTRQRQEMTARHKRMLTRP